MWVKESLTLSPAELAGVSIWLSLPWTVKMVFGELVDSVPIFGSQRTAYVLIGAALIACGLLTLAGAAGKWLTFLPPNRLYILGSVLLVIGTVVQDVVADAMTTEVVARHDEAGNPRPDDVVRTELGMVQVLGRLALTIGVLAVAGLSGWLAFVVGRETVFLLGLIVPAMSVAGILLRRPAPTERRPVNWRILGGGLAYGAVVLALALAEVRFNQEIIFALSMTVVCTMLVFVTRQLEPQVRRSILFVTVIIFAFRATPAVGDGFFWFTIDVLKFDEAFYGTLRQTSAIVGLVALWVLSKQITEYSVAKTLFWITIVATLIALPNVGLIYGLHEWTEQRFGFGARTIAFVDTVAGSPFAQLSMVPLLALIAYYAPVGQRATWFALMASLLNLALVAGQLQTKYLNQALTVGRGVYGELGLLMIVVVALGFVVPLAAIAVWGRRV
jgi:hypothetical protein